MLSRERERTEEANRRADEAWRELAEERKRSDERIEALISQANKERQLATEERQQAAEERRVMMSTIAELTNAIAELRRQDSNGQ